MIYKLFVYYTLISLLFLQTQDEHLSVEPTELPCDIDIQLEVKILQKFFFHSTHSPHEHPLDFFSNTKCSKVSHVTWSSTLFDYFGFFLHYIYQHRI